MSEDYGRGDDVKFCCCQCGKECYAYDGEVSDDSEDHKSFTCFSCMNNNSQEYPCELCFKLYREMDKDIGGLDHEFICEECRRI